MAHLASAAEEVGQLLTRHHGGLDWPALLGSLRQLAFDVNQSGTTTTTAGAVAAEKVRPLADLFVEVFALSSKISLVLDDAGVTDRVAAIFARHADPASLAIAAAGGEKNMDGLVQDFAEVVELASVTTLPTLYATVTNDFFAGLRSLQGESARGQELLARALQYLASKSDQSQGYQILGEDKPYLSGRFFNSEEKGVYLYNGSFGLLQVGIPPETIKTYMSKGQPVPHIYVLPPRLFMGAVNFGEVEFPIYFNFFIKKAFQNPDLRVIMIGTKDQLEKVRVSFQESVFGPEEHHLYI
ncbi:3',5'-cyclic-GMP phosphodiesterase, partial [Acanthamoeba castellanii str. Neff]